MATPKTYTRETDWPDDQVVNSGRIQDLPSGGWQTWVQPGDNPINSSGNRNELLDTDNRIGGDEELWLKGTWELASDWVPASSWDIVGQLHLKTGGTQPTIIIACSGSSKFQVKWSAGGGHSVAYEWPLVKAQRQEVIVHWTNSRSGETHPLEVWVNGVAVATKTARVGDGSNDQYFKNGRYVGSGPGGGPVKCHGFQLSKTPLSPGPPAEDTTGPTVTCPIPEDAALQPGLPDGWTCEATDPSGVASVEFLVDGVKVLEEVNAPYGDSKSPDGTPWTTTCAALLVPGSHVLANRATDRSANANAHQVERHVHIMGEVPPEPEPGPEPDVDTALADIASAQAQLAETTTTLDHAAAALTPGRAAPESGRGAATR